MKNYKFVEMTDKVANIVTERAFGALRVLFKLEPLAFSYQDVSSLITISCDYNENLISKEVDVWHNEKSNDVVYRFLYGNRIYIIELFDNEGFFGYLSCLPVVDRERYVFCNIKEERPDGSKRFEIDFAIDIEKGTFLELFAIEYYTLNNVIREYKAIDRLESILSGTQILDICVE